MITVTTDGAAVMSHVGSRLLAGMADCSGLTVALSDALSGLRERRSAHDPGRVLADLAVLLADGGRSISDLAVLRDQPMLFGSVASPATAWRVLDRIDSAALNRMRAARARAREQLWAQRAETVGPFGGHRAGGRIWPGLRIMFDATLVTAHSDKESAAPNCPCMRGSWRSAVRAAAAASVARCPLVDHLIEVTAPTAGHPSFPWMERSRLSRHGWPAGRSWVRRAPSYGACCAHPSIYRTAGLRSGTAIQVPREPG